MVRSDSFTTKVASDDIWWEMKSHLTMRLPWFSLAVFVFVFITVFCIYVFVLMMKLPWFSFAALRKEGSLNAVDVGRDPHLFSLFLTFHFCHLIGFLIRDLLPLDHSSLFIIHHHLTVQDLLPKSSLWKCKTEESFYAFHRKSAIKLFCGGTLSHNAWCSRQEFLRFVSRCCTQHPRFCGCTIPHNLRRLMGFSGGGSTSSSCGNVSGNGRWVSGNVGCNASPHLAAAQLLPCFAIAESACGKCNPSSPNLFYSTKKVSEI